MWDAFWLTAVEGRSVEVVAEELAKNPGAIYAAQPRDPANPGESDRVRAGHVGRRVRFRRLVCIVCQEVAA